jgi:hypothetical protein
MRVLLDLDPASDPIQGRVRAESAPAADARPFSGWLELSSLIEQLRAGVRRPGHTTPDSATLHTRPVA